MAAGPDARATRSSRRPSTGCASTAPTARSWSRAIRRDRRARPPSTSARSGSTAALTSSSSWPSPTGDRARRSPCAGRHPELGRQLATWCRQQGHRWRAPLRAGDARPWVLSSAGRRPAPAGSAPSARGGADPAVPGAVVAGSRPPPLGPGRPRRRRRARRPRTGRSGWPAATSCGPTGRRASTPRRSPPSGIPPPPSTGAPPITHADAVEAAVVAGDDVPHRERGGGAGGAGPLPRPDASPLPRDPAGPRGDGGRRGAPHRRLHPAGHDDRAPAGAVDRRWAGVAADPARRARLRHRRASCCR